MWPGSQLVAAIILVLFETALQLSGFTSIYLAAALWSLALLLAGWWLYQRVGTKMTALTVMMVSGVVCITAAAVYFWPTQPESAALVPRSVPAQTPAVDAAPAATVPAVPSNPYSSLSPDDIATKFGIWTELIDLFNSGTNVYNTGVGFTEGWHERMANKPQSERVATLEAFKQTFRTNVVEKMAQCRKAYSRHPEVLEALKYDGADALLAAADALIAAGVSPQAEELPRAKGVLDRELKRLLRWNDAGQQARTVNLKLLQDAQIQ